MALWGGRFEGESDPRFQAINDSLSVDWRLVQEDIEGSIAWAEALEHAGVLSPDETGRTVAALKEIADHAAAEPRAVGDARDEDVHAWVEAQLIERVGALGKKLHTGRSRNDQVATDLRLWTRRQVSARQVEIRSAQQALLRLAEREPEAMLPGYTHLQRAQPVLLAHWCLAYFEMLQRDHERLGDAAARLDRCPLGSGALAGTSYPVDRQALAEALGFAGPTLNSLDAVSDRDFVVEVLSAAALCGVHLSRLAEDLIFYASDEAGFVELDDSVTSGSSLLPHKKNPDALELIRGKAGRLLGSLVSILVTLKGLPLAYNKDLQEDKVPLFDAMDSLALCLKVMPPILDRLRFCPDKAAAAVERSYSNAVDLADYLVAKGVPFRQAHATVGQIVRHAIRRGLTLDELPVEEMTELSPEIGADIGEFIAARHSMSRRNVIGGTSPSQVAEARRCAEARLDESLSASGEPLGAVRQVT
ncbi:MAG: argininosuccinate lyase [Planctomycetota bacterium]|jgi:argininosuccinate lyase